MNRANRRSKKTINEVMDDLVIAGLKVTINNKLPDGVMVVSPAEGERLTKLVAEAQAKAAAKLNKAETQEEGK